LCSSPNFSAFAESFYFLCTYFAFWLLKWGWNTFGLSRFLCLYRDAHLSALHDSLLFAEPLYLLPLHDSLFSTEPHYLSTLHDSLFSTEPFYLSTLHNSLFSTEPHYLSALHDHLISIEMPSFPRLRQDSLFLPKRLLLLHLDTFVSTAPPFFCCARTFWFHRDVILLMHHDTLWVAQNPFAWKPLTALSGGNLRAQSSEKHGRHGTWILCHTVSVQTSAMLKNNCVTLIFTTKIWLVVSHELFSDFKDSLCLFHDFAFCSFKLCILHQLLFFIDQLCHSLHVLCFLCGF